MPCPNLCKYLTGPQEPAHPLRSVHYLLALQAVFAIIIIALTLYSLENKGWWTGLETPSLIAIFASLWTITHVFLLRSRVLYESPTETRATRRVRKIFGVILILVAIGFNLAASFLMPQSPGKDFKYAFEDPPFAAWRTAFALTVIQFFISAWCAFRITDDSSTSLEDEQPSADNEIYIIELEDISLHTATPGRESVPIPPTSPPPSRDAENQADPNEASPTVSQGPKRKRTLTNPFRSRNPFRGHRDSTEEDILDVVAESSQSHQQSSKARGKQKETHADDDDAFELGLAGVDEHGKSWTPV